MTFGIAIPTYNKHICHLGDLLNSIESNTVLPDKVSISCSEINDKIVLRDYPFEILLSETGEYRNASQNRNIAAYALHTDIISFIDSDDISTPYRNEYLINSFKNENVKVIVHNFSVFSRISGVINNIVERSPIELKINYLNVMRSNIAFPVNNEDNIIKKMHCGHVTMTKDIFNLFKYDQGIVRSQDTELLQRIVNKGIPISYIVNELSYYRNDE